MSTYRKFDKYRQRADFLSDIEFGIDTPANKWVATGTGSPAVALVAGKGLSVATSSGGTATSFIQRGIISAATKSSPVALVKGLKAHIVASISSDDLGDFGFALGFATAAADPVAEAARVLLKYVPGDGFVAELGATKTITVERVLADLVVDGQLGLEVYYDGTDHVQFFAGRQRIAKLEAAFHASTGASTDAAGALSPTFGVVNGGVAAAHTAVLHVLGYAAQRVPAHL